MIRQGGGPLIQLEEVRKSYGKHVAVRSLNLMVPAGSVYGFLGPNGAGKSTTIRMILGLQRSDRGTLSVFGKDPWRYRNQIYSRVGSLVEAPVFYPNLTGRENLEVHSRLMGLGKTAVDKALDAVTLRIAAGELVAGYSSGMRQRLGIANALLANPELLILDEPTNNLDPAGILDVRELIAELKQRRVTVFLSSHLLAEVEQVASHIGVISQGELKFEGTSEELRQTVDETITVVVDRPEVGTRLLAASGFTTIWEGSCLRVKAGANKAPEIAQLMVSNGLLLSSMTPTVRKLEEYFLEITK